MSDADLRELKRLITETDWLVGPPAALDLVNEVERLREENEFLKELIKDLKAESTAYRRGIEDGWHGTVGSVGRR